MGGYYTSAYIRLLASMSLPVAFVLAFLSYEGKHTI